ncbi:von Willebrand factor type A domain-containing protein [Ornithinimicrobium sp. F0845]|uniref:vWA domain-containing protein n=1 Tax=Ornithinimicrobium sp. F0845 TaxID=2926412 RepID=UPI001FF0FF6D|nr:von Willebrand factor type A domain-containing protein [Ornithinimicrobium sp. F0845]MCK0110599.1 von Willebrand factor type A domain-containing protein [Ornithinimicrobium sp. F0845]
MKNTTLLAMLLVVGLGATACSGDSEPHDPTEGTQGADHEEARRYVEDYDEQADMDGAGAPAPSTTLKESAADAGVGVEPVPVPPIPPGPGEDNTFTDVGETVWVRAQEDPQSTFALDVDTGSYRVAHAMVAEGLAPEPDSIRVEEWVNAFEYGDQAPEDTALGLQVETGAAPRAAEGTALVRVGVSSVEIADEDRPQANITFVVDTSGSMDIRNRLGLVQSSLALLVDSLNPDDTIAIVIYGDEATPLLEPTRVADRDTIINAIEDLRPGGSTNMEAGLRMGYSQARTAHVEDGINAVVLASDGVANVGVSDGGALAEEIAGAGEEGIHLVTVGYGMGNYNDTLMEQLANQGDGFYAYLDTFEEAEQLFVEDLTETLTVVARDAKSQVEFDPEFVESYRLIGYQNRALEDDEFRDDTVDAGELGAGHQVSALYELVPTGAVTDGTVVGEARLRWADPDSGETTEVNAPIEWSQAEATDALQLAALVADSAELLKGNSIVSERGFTLKDLREEAETLAGSDVAGIEDLLDLLDEDLRAPVPYEERD